MRVVPPPSPRQTGRGTSEAGFEGGDSLWCSEIPSISEFSRYQVAPTLPASSPVIPLQRRAVSPHCAEILADFPEVKGAGQVTWYARFCAVGSAQVAPREDNVLQNVRGQGGSIVVLDPMAGVRSVEQESSAMRHASFRGSPLRRPFTSFVPQDDWCPPEVKTSSEPTPSRERKGHPALPGRALRRCFSSVSASRSQGIDSPWRREGDSGPTGSRVTLTACNSAGSSPINSMRGSPHWPRWQASKVRSSEQSSRLRRPESAPCIGELVNKQQVRVKTAPTGARKVRPKAVPPDAESGRTDVADDSKAVHPELSRYCQAFAAAVENFRGERVQVLNASTVTLPSRRYAVPPKGGIPFALKEPYPEAPRQGYLCSNISGINALLASQRSALSRSGVLDAASKPGGA